jgi:hypothetical protein
MENPSRQPRELYRSRAELLLAIGARSSAFLGRHELVDRAFDEIVYFG